MKTQATQHITATANDLSTKYADLCRQLDTYIADGFAVVDLDIEYGHGHCLWLPQMTVVETEKYWRGIEDIEPIWSAIGPAGQNCALPGIAVAVPTRMLPYNMTALLHTNEDSYLARMSDDDADCVRHAGSPAA